MGCTESLWRCMTCRTNGRAQESEARGNNDQLSRKFWGIGLQVELTEEITVSCFLGGLKN